MAALHIHPVAEAVTILNRATIRKWHSYIGLFTAPSVLFFALTGALQLFHLHEEHGDYKPLPLIEKLGSVHKDQEFAAGGHHGPPGGGPPQGPGPGGPDDGEKGEAPATFVLKGFFLLVALSLSVSTVFGLWIGLVHTPRRTVGLSLVVAGTLIPIVLLML
jgi:hypothetical protein